MNKGSYGIACLYLCLIDSSEQLTGLPAHYQLAGELKEIGKLVSHFLVTVGKHWGFIFFVVRKKA